MYSSYTRPRYQVSVYRTIGLLFSILLAILLHGQFIYHTQISLLPKTQFFNCSAVCLSVIFELLPGLILFTSDSMLGKF